MNQEDLNKIQTILGQSQSILILTGKRPTLDSLGASLALYLALSRMGKAVNIACPELPTVGLSNLVGIDKVKNDLGGQNLIVSFPYVEGSIEKVSYNIEDNQFNLVVQPRTGARPLSPQSVKFSHGGANADLIFILGTRDLTDLGPLYEKEKDLYSQITSVVIDCQAENKQYGRINFVNPYASSISEIVGFIVGRLGINLDSDIAHNLLTGIDFATQSFSSPTATVEAFELATACLKVGAKRTSAPLVRKPALVTDFEATGVARPKTPRIPVENLPQETSEEEAPPDWLAPKIFKGSNLP